MQIKDRAIVLQCVKYADKKHIVKLYTEHHGVLSCSARVSNSPSSRIKTSSLIPLSILEVDIIAKENKDVKTLVEANAAFIFTDLHYDLNKISLAQFLAEILNKVLKEQTGQTELFEFIVRQMVMLDTATKNFSSFHVHFLIDLLDHIGLYPNNNIDRVNRYFDCREGKFTPVELPFPNGLNESSSLLLSGLLKDREDHIPLDSASRNILLDTLLAYYRFHIPGFNELKSWDVLKEVFAN